MPLGKIVSFKAGKIHVFSDFDGTYCPAKHSSLHDPNANKHMPEYARRMGDFFKTTQGDVHFHVTTGRTYGEYNAISWLLKMRGFELPLPESFIAKNGSDEYTRRGTDEAFYQKGEFPFSYTSTSKAKEDLIRQETNWDGVKIKAKIKELADKYHIKMVEADSENSAKDYGERSLFSQGKLKADEWRRMPSKNGVIQKHSPLVDYVIGSRNDGNLKVHLIFPPDYGFCDERNGLYDGFMSEIRKFLKDNKVKFHESWEEHSDKNGWRNRVSLTPLVDDGELTKVFDTKLSVQNARLANDLVVVAGDGSNDFQMLNPLEYLDKKFLAKCAENSKYKEFYQNKDKMLHVLRRILHGRDDRRYPGLLEELNSNGFLKQLKELPLFSIVVERKKDSALDVLVDVFSSIGKVIAVEKGQIDSGISQAIERFAGINETFKKSMSEKLTNFIFNSQKKNGVKVETEIRETNPVQISQQQEKTGSVKPKTPKPSKQKAGTKHTKLIIGIIGGILVLIGAAYAYLKNKESKANADN